MAQGSGSGSGKARAVDDPASSSAQRHGTGTDDRSLPAGANNSSTNGKEPNRVIPGAAGLRAGGIAAELAGLLRSSGKAGPSSAPGSAAALGGALDGANAPSATFSSGPVHTTAREAFRQAATRAGPALSGVGRRADDDEAATFFGSHPADQIRSSGSAPAEGGSGIAFQHPLLRPGAPLSPRLAAYSEALRGPWSTASDLDGELHAQARRQNALIASTHLPSGIAITSSSEWTQEFLDTHAGGRNGPDSAQTISDEAALERAWSSEYGASQHWPANFTEEQRAQLLDPAYHGAWAQNAIPTNDFGGQPLVFDGHDDSDSAAAAFGTTNSAVAHQTQPEPDFFAALEAEEREEEQRSRTGPRTPAQPISQAAELANMGINPNLLPSGITESWRPPSPSQVPSVSVEQLLLHRALAEKQEAREDGTGANADRIAEQIRPADDDERERQGIYAATPEDALRSVWDGQAEAERVRKDKEARLVDIAKREREGTTQQLSLSNEEDVQRLISEVKMWFPRGSYADEVHGMPPLLAQTLADAQLPAEESDPELIERRLAAIRRLDAMRGHLFAGRSHSPSSFSTRPAGQAHLPAAPTSGGVGYDAITAAFDQVQLEEAHRRRA